jgi:hypothetical protein
MATIGDHILRNYLTWALRYEEPEVKAPGSQLIPIV